LQFEVPAFLAYMHIVKRVLRIIQIRNQVDSLQ